MELNLADVQSFTVTVEPLDKTINVTYPEFEMLEKERLIDFMHRFVELNLGRPGNELCLSRGIEEGPFDPITKITFHMKDGSDVEMQGYPLDDVGNFYNDLRKYVNNPWIDFVEQTQDKPVVITPRPEPAPESIPTPTPTSKSDIEKEDGGNGTSAAASAPAPEDPEASKNVDVRENRSLLSRFFPKKNKTKNVDKTEPNI